MRTPGDSKVTADEASVDGAAIARRDGARYAPRDESEARATGLYDPRFEHDACGVGFVANLDGRPSHATVSQALGLLSNLEHRGAAGTDPLTGDGAGILLQVPHEFFARELSMRGAQLPPQGWYGVGMLFLPSDHAARSACEALVEPAARALGCRIVAWRDVPTEPLQLGRLARKTVPVVRQVFIAPVVSRGDVEQLERRLYLLRRRVEHEARVAKLPLYVCSLSARTIVYKGLLLPDRMARFFKDLGDPATAASLAVVHQRFSTNTFPAWERAHPYRMIAHNGEINALRGNVNAMRAREASLGQGAFGDEARYLAPVIQPDGSDSAMFDNVAELLVRGGRSLPHALAMMVPEAWEKDPAMPAARRSFYEYHAALMEPWDGPAALVFTDGVRVGAMLDRNGLRPFRVTVTHDGLVVGASETGALPIDTSRIAQKTRVAPGRMLVVDTEANKIFYDAEIKEQLASRRPYRVWLDAEQVSLARLTSGEARTPRLPLRARQRVHGYTLEEKKLVLGPMAVGGQEPVGSMGNDAPIAALSEEPQLLFNYFRQLFAQVTNPPIDPIREALVMSLRTSLGVAGDLLDETPQHVRQLVLEHPVLSGDELSRIEQSKLPGLHAVVLDALWAPGASGALERALDALCADAERAAREGNAIVVLSDRAHDRERAPIPALLAVAAVHHHLIRAGVRGRCSLVSDTGEAREVMHFCLLVGYGAAAVHPSVACESVEEIAREQSLDPRAAVKHYLDAANKGIAKVMSKMGISTLASYRGAQIFEALGLRDALVERYFTGTATRLGGLGLDEIAREYEARMRAAFRVPLTQAHASGDEPLEPGGVYQWRRRGEHHEYSPEVIGLLQHAVRSANPKLFERYSRAVHAKDRLHKTLRGLLAFKPSTPVALDEVEPAREIVKRFKTGAMSFGSISREAHETLAVAMNRIGGRSNSGEGGEDEARYFLEPNGDWKRSAIKQIASGRFGVTSHYLVNADELQIKMAQGAKPGEGGQLPGHKVDEVIARVRLATPGVQLISPPPHHDIYSIEDLAQLIFDLKNANDRARVSVKLVSEVGVGTVAAGVAKAKADVILISGDAGGTGAAPLTSLKHAGIPWELGLAEAQQVLVLNGLRGRVRLEVDGQLKTGRDVAIACLLGAEEFGFATAALVATGCVMMRVCHLNTCPVGIATQDPELRKRFAGMPEHVINFMLFVAEEFRGYMAQLGFRTVDEMVGRVDRLEPALEGHSDDAPRLEAHWKARGIDLRAVLQVPQSDVLRCVEAQDHGLAQGLDARIIDQARDALERRGPVELEYPISNRDRAVCTRLSAEISRRHGAEGLPPGTIRIRFEGSAGQSFGAFMAEGVEAVLVGEANDYLGKGLSGGRIVVTPGRSVRFVPEENAIVGNTVLYGATGGEVFLRGRAGERFAVRNSGARAVVEGVGDHGCEYMTRGVVVVLGPTGRNFGAGMSGGVAFVLDQDGAFASRCNTAMVELGRPDEGELTMLRALVQKHYDCTGSALAWRLLAGWREQSQRFVRVLPTEEKRARERSSEKGSYARLEGAVN